MQRLNHHHLYIFWIFGQVGSFTLTAQRLSIAQSAVTTQIKQLEQSLGFLLINRNKKRSTELTHEGHKVLEFANSIFESSQELLRWAAEGQAATQVIKVGALSGLSRNLQYEFLAPSIGKPGIKIEVTTGDQDNLLQLLKNHSIDVILSSHNVKSAEAVSLYSHVLTSSPIVFVLATERRRKDSIDLATQLAQRSLYLPGSNFEVRPELDAFLDQLNCTFQIAGEIDDIALLRIFALRSGALTALPEMGVKNDIENGSLTVIKRTSAIQQRFYAITRQRRIPNRNLQLLIQSIRKEA